MLEFKDILGQDLKYGDRIAYARQGRGSEHGSLVIGRIVDLSIRPPLYSWNKEIPVAKVMWEPNERYGWMNKDITGRKTSVVTKFENMVKL